MKIIGQTCDWMQAPPADTLQIIERAGRTCYKSEDKITPDSAAAFVKRIMASHHESVIEHVSASMLFTTDRGVTHEMVRHRIASYSQESTRYCNYCKGKFDGEITVILPTFFYAEHEDSKPKGMFQMVCAGPEPTTRQRVYSEWAMACYDAEKRYKAMIDLGATAQEARSVLPNSLKTEIVMTANMREWRHFFALRCSQAAHPQMRDLATQALRRFAHLVPVLFDDLAIQYLQPKS